MTEEDETDERDLLDQLGHWMIAVGYHGAGRGEAGLGATGVVTGQREGSLRAATGGLAMRT